MVSEELGAICSMMEMPSEDGNGLRGLRAPLNFILFYLIFPGQLGC